MLGFAQSALITIASFLFVLTFVVTVHELGHFIAARSLGVAVDRFSIGFGRAIVRWFDKAGVAMMCSSSPERWIRKSIGSPERIRT
jgi:regulator of sigma E protease